ncbi:9177_t:CDS:2, partial [Racocetra persica]
HWLSKETLSRWNKEVAKISLYQNRPGNPHSTSYSYGVMADESTRGDKKVFLVCFSYWDAYKNQPMITLAKMIDLNKYSGAIVAKTANAFSFRIPCGLHALQIALVAFENTAFGKLNTVFDNVPRVLENNIFKCLLSGHRAHELTDQVLFWLGKLQSAINDPYIIFEEQIIEACSNLCNQELTALINNLKSGLEKAREGFLKWMGCWIHLPLTICLLGGSNGPDFAR